MRVLLVHASYRYRGGEDVAFESEAALLEASGHSVRTLRFDNADLPSNPLAAAVRTVRNPEAAARVGQAAGEFEAEVVHFHNTFPLVSPAAYGAAKRTGAAVVQTLHNYRLACVNALLFRSGRVCTDCVGRSPWPGAWRRCYRGSLGASSAVALMLAYHRRTGTWRRDVDLYLAVSGFVRSVVVAAGLPEDRVRVKPNFLSPDPGLGAPQRQGVAFVGRLSEEKGILTVLEAWARHTELPPLFVAGDGPCRDAVEKAAAAGRVGFRGAVSREAALRLVGECEASLQPSLCPDAMPMALVEAYAKGTPVVASNVESLASLVRSGLTGEVFSAGDPDQLAEAVVRVTRRGDWLALSRAARAEYERLYSAESAKRNLEEAYQWAILHRQP